MAYIKILVSYKCFSENVGDIKSGTIIITRNTQHKPIDDIDDSSN